MFSLLEQSKLLSMSEAAPDTDDKNRCGYLSFGVGGLPGAVPIIYEQLLQS